MEKLSYNADEVKSVLGLSLSGVYEAARKGDLPSVRIGRRLIFPKQGIDRLLSEAVGKAAA